MNDPLAPTVALEIGGEERHLRLDFNALAKAEGATGRNYLMVRNIQRGGAADMTAILWGGLLHESPKLTLDEVRSWVHLGNVNRVIEAIFEAVRLSFPEPEDGESGDAGEDGDADPLPATPPRGRRSARTRASTSG